MSNILTPGSDFKQQSIPQRIVSLVPSQTELLYDLGLEDRMVGITKFCVHPPHLKKTKSIIGGTKKVNIEKIRLLKPDLIIANKEENTLQMVVELQKICQVWITDISSIEDNSIMIENFGKYLGCEAAAKVLNEEISNAVSDFASFIINRPMIRAIYLIWENPYMAAGANTFIDAMLKLNHFHNCCQQSRYPEINLNEMKGSHPELILLSSEPFPFTQKHVSKIVELTSINTIVVDGEMFSWYGSRLLKALNYYKTMHEEINNQF